LVGTLWRGGSGTDEAAKEADGEAELVEPVAVGVERSSSNMVSSLLSAYLVEGGVD